MMDNFAIRHQNAQTPEVKFPPGYEMREHGDKPGLYYVECNKDGELTETWLTYPFHFLGITKDKDSLEWGRLLQWNDPAGKQHTWAIPREMLEGDPAEYRRQLVRAGLECLSGTREKQLFNHFLIHVRGRFVLCV